ncbi:conjugal transfer protein TraD [Xanthomonas hyacinthi]|uniref:Conjugal transfer protein TraD n=1 Tax=Xanthomonas hyacinthi TaxID=56455 RepID=A0A2S7ENN2_9XANT|nr:conjugal transfer protein TraD [Xanthomonas hyacinthi]KLD76245.1 hypothetical protein Y886_22390 [Xanthomonas hyacinthi DSM 19077]PPU93228.1 hypothetical protein XhyaCFBP1156_20760 [Xanthomonas hyacinthi]QGY77823.1 conjugal transfer protein TraD [Xanthomonas hyacinthi]
MTKLEERIDSTAARLAQLKNQQRLKDQAQAAREKKAKRRAQAKTLAQLSRQEDAHRKIVLGGLVIASDADGWDPAEIVGALLFMAERMSGQPGLLEQCRRKGMQHLAAREAMREKSRS